MLRFAMCIVCDSMFIDIYDYQEVLISVVGRRQKWHRYLYIAGRSDALEREKPYR